MEHVRSIFVSDVHLGCRYSNAAAFLEFIRHHKCDYLYLVGDFFDGWQLKKNWYWNDTYSYIVRRIIKMMKKGTKVYYTPGNHDEFLRDFVYNLGSVQIADEFVHATADGRKLLILHGDKFDSVVLHAKWLSLIGDVGYNALLGLNRVFNAVRRRMGFDYWSLSQSIKKKVKQATNVISNFEKVVERHAQSKGCQGAVCGHIHTPVIHTRESGFIYYNTGDWVESCTALLEDYDGTIRLVHYPLHWEHSPQVAAGELDHEASEMEIPVAADAAEVTPQNRVATEKVRANRRPVPANAEHRSDDERADEPEDHPEAVAVLS